jgi:hypothetical protein
MNRKDKKPPVPPGRIIRRESGFVGKADGGDDSFQRKGGHISGTTASRLPKVKPNSPEQGAKPADAVPATPANDTGRP